MAVRRTAPDLENYLEDDKTTEDELFETEDENSVAERSSVVQVGWAAAKKAVDKVNSAYATDFKFTEDVQLIKFLSSEPMSFSQHWVQRTGKKSFICLGTSDCPLCRAGNKPESKFAFSVVALSDETPAVKLMVVGLRLTGQLEKLNSDPKTGPLDRLFWAVSKSGQGAKTTYSIMPVKSRDLAEDWELDVAEVSDLLDELEPLGVDALRAPSKSELSEIARELPEE